MIYTHAERHITLLAGGQRKGGTKMTYTLYATTEGTVKVYRDQGYEYYLDIDNRWDKTFDSKKEFERYMKQIKAEYIGIDED